LSEICIKAVHYSLAMHKLADKKIHNPSLKDYPLSC